MWKLKKNKNTANIYIYIYIYMVNIIKRKSRPTDIENKLVVTSGEKEEEEGQ